MRFLSIRFIGPWGVLLGILISLAVYWPGLHGGFFFDDGPNIVNNPGVRLHELSGEALESALSSGFGTYLSRPVSQLSFALNYYFSGFDPLAFKLTNLLLHCLNGILVYLLVWQLLDSIRQRFPASNIEISAALATCIWMIHPIQLTSVLYVVQRMTSLSAFFLLAALILHIKARRREAFDWVAAACLISAWFFLWPLSILSKENGVLLLGFVAIYELIVRRSEKGFLDLFGRMVLHSTLVGLVGLFLYSISPFGHWLVSGYENRAFSLAERLLTESRAIWEYLGLIAFPRLDAFSLFHDDFALSTSLFSPWTTFPAVIGLVLLAIIAATGWRRLPLVAFSIAWFLIGHSLESSFIPLELVHEHRNYVPLLGLCLLPAGIVGRLANMSGAKRVMIVASLGALLAYFGLVTALRANMFGHDLIRTQLEAQYHPDSPRANYEAGRVLAAMLDSDRGNLMVAVLSKKHFERATSLDQNYKMGLFGLLVFGCGTSQMVDKEALDQLQRRFKERLILAEDTSILMAVVEMSRVGNLCLERSEIDDLFASFLANPRGAPDTKMTMHALHADYLWLSEKDLPAAREALENALELAPRNASLRLKRAQLDFIEGENDKARNLLLELRDENFSPKERETLNQVLQSLDHQKK